MLAGLHLQVLHLARERVAAPAQQLRRVALAALGVLQRDLDHDPLEGGGGLLQDVMLALHQFVA